MISLEDVTSAVRPARLLLSCVCTAVLLGGSLFVTFGTEWGWERQFFRGVVLLSALPLGVSALARFRRYRRPAALLFVGVLVFWIGVAGGACRQPLLRGDATWQFVYDWGRNYFYFGWPHDTRLGYTCLGSPNRPLAALGYLCSTGGTALGLGALDPAE